MKHEDGYRSDYVDDLRGGSPSGGGGEVAGLAAFLMSNAGKGGLGLGVVVIIVLVAFGPKLIGSFTSDRAGLGVQNSSNAVERNQYKPSPAEQKLFSFASQVFDDAQATWNKVFANEMGQQYRKARMTVFTGSVKSACGTQSSAVGPFYCPADQKVYIDLGFFGDLDKRFGAPGDFAQAYVIAHEVGHHVQNLIGVFTSKPRRGETKNQHSIRQELQADCFAGVWGHWAQKRNLLDPGDLEEGFNAAKAIGDDTLQRRGRGHVTPETWTHGSSQQRKKWFRKGLKSGRMSACNALTIAKP